MQIIKKCFDRINPKKLLEKLNLKSKLGLQIKNGLESGVIDNRVFDEITRKTLQGGVIFSLLANIALDGMEIFAKELVKSISLKPTTRASGRWKSNGFKIKSEQPRSYKIC